MVATGGSTGCESPASQLHLYALVCMLAYHRDLISHFSKLLQQLDKASQEDPVGIEEAVLDKGWEI